MKTAVAERIEAEGGMSLGRRLIDGQDGVVDDVWSSLADGDFPAVTISAAYGGLDDTQVSFGAVVECLGRYAVPAPYAETVAFVAPLVERLGSEAQCERFLGGIAEDGMRASFALHDDPAAELPESIRLEGVRDGDAVVLNGTKPLVPYGGSVDEVIVAARMKAAAEWNDIALLLVDATAVDTTRLDSLDGTRPMYRLSFDDVSVPPKRQLGSPANNGTALRAAIDRYRLAGCFELVGAAERAVDRSVEQGTERRQYGYPVGMYQAVKHRIAEMYRDVKQARQLSYYAAWALDQNDPDAKRAVSAATAFVTARCRRVFEDDIKNHGGWGFTWDDHGHVYLKRAKAWEVFAGSIETHRDRVAAERGF